jgi:hypothetical protein
LAQVRRTMRLSVFEGSLTQVFLNWTSGSVLIGYMLHVGARPAEIALVGAGAAAGAGGVAVRGVPGGGAGAPQAPDGAARARLAHQLAARRGAAGAAAWRRSCVRSFLVALVLVASFFLASNGTLWTAWMGDVCRSASAVATSVCARASPAWSACSPTCWPAGGSTGSARPLSFQVVILVVAVATALIGVWIYWRQYDPPTVRERLRLREIVTVPLADPGFRRFLAFAVYWTFVVFLAAPFVFPYFLDELRLTFTQVAIWSTIAATTSMATTVLWGRGGRSRRQQGRAGDRHLRRRRRVAGHLDRGRRQRLDRFHLDLGRARRDRLGRHRAGHFNLALVSAPRQNRVLFIAMWSLTSGVAGFVGGALSGPLLVGFQSLSGGLGNDGWVPYAWLFALSGVLRAFTWVLLRRVPEANAWRTRELLRSMRTGWKGVGFPWRS